MRESLKLLWGIGILALTIAANVEMGANDCSKWCGAAGNGDFGSREGCGSDDGCAWVECIQSRWGCSDAFNDACGTPDWCPPLE